MLTFAIQNDFKFTVQPKVNGEMIDLSEMEDLSITCVNRFNGLSFRPIFTLKETGIEIEVQKEQVKQSGDYFVYFTYRRADGSYSDLFQDKKIGHIIFKIVPVGDQTSNDEETVEITVSPEYKGADGVTPHIGSDGYWYLGDTSTGVKAEGVDGKDFKYSDFTQEQIALLQKPASDAASQLEVLEQNVENAESNRLSSEYSRNSNEETRVSNENSRFFEEENRQVNEQARSDSEEQRISAESGRELSEQSRRASETSREENEASRVSAENARVSSESSRVSAESLRSTDESSRKTAETSRANAEALRVSAESARVTAEQNRVIEFNSLVGSLESIQTILQSI